MDSNIYIYIYIYGERDRQIEIYRERVYHYHFENIIVLLPLLPGCVHPIIYIIIYIIVICLSSGHQIIIIRAVIDFAASCCTYAHAYACMHARVRPYQSRDPEADPDSGSDSGSASGPAIPDPDRGPFRPAPPTHASPEAARERGGGGREGERV